MSEPLKLSIDSVIEKDVTDLELCLMLLRKIAKYYPRHFDIAIEALRREFNLPEVQAVGRYEDDTSR